MYDSYLCRTTTGVIVLIAGGGATVAGLMTVGNLLSFFAGIMILRGPTLDLTSESVIGSIASRLARRA